MMKWLRKHTKQIMVGVVLFAMFSFVGGQALTKLISPNPGSFKIGTAFGKDFTRNDVASVSGDLDILQTFLGPAWYANSIHPDMRPIHWYMLTREAARSGIVIPDEQIKATLDGMGITPEFLAQFSTRRRFSYPVVMSAFGRFIAVQSLAQRVMSIATPSEAEMRHYVRDTEEKVRVSLVVLDAEHFVEPDEKLDEAEVQAHFDAHKDLRPEESEDGFGYRFPRRVAVQYFGAAIKDIESQVPCTLDEAVAYWRKNKQSYVKIETVYRSESQPADQPAPPPERKRVEMKFSEARMRVERDVREGKARHLLEQAMRNAGTELLQPWQDQPVDVNTGYKERIPDVVKAPDFMRKICDQVSRSLGVPLTFKETGLLSQKELEQEPGIGRAFLPISAGEQLAFPEYAFRIPRFFKKKRGSETTLSLQLFQTPDSPLIQARFRQINGQPQQVPTAMFSFRVVDARDEEMPDSLDEVREKVMTDLRREHAFRRMEQDAKALYAGARRLGLNDALDSMKDLCNKAEVKRAFGPTAISRLNAQTLDVTFVPVVGAPSKTLVDACFEMAAADWTPDPMELPDLPAASTRPAKDPAPVVRLVPLPKLKKWVVVELDGLDPVREDQYETKFRSEAFTYFANSKGRRVNEIRTSWFKPENIETRCDFVPAQAATSDEESSEG